MKELRIAAIILNWNTAADTLACVASIHAIDNPNLSVIIVDNASTDSSWEKLQQIAATDVTLIQSGANLGYAGGNNIGIRAALDWQADFIWILNPDTIVDPQCLNELLKAAEKHPRAGVFVPKILYKDRPQTLWYAGGDYDSMRAQTNHWGFGAEDKGDFDDTSCKVTFATGCSLFVRHEVFEQVGLLDERYFLYWEDTQFSGRALRAGYEICYVPAARVWHQLMASSGQHDGRSPTYDYYNLRNRLWYVHEAHSGRTKISAYMWTVPLLLRRLARIAVRREKYWKETVIAVARGLRDGVFGGPPRASKKRL